MSHFTTDRIAVIAASCPVMKTIRWNPQTLESGGFLSQYGGILTRFILILEGDFLIFKNHPGILGYPLLTVETLIYPHLQQIHIVRLAPDLLAPGTPEIIQMGTITKLYWSSHDWELVMTTGKILQMALFLPSDYIISPYINQY